MKFVTYEAFRHPNHPAYAKAGARYSAHLELLSRRVPPQVIAFARQSFHDLIVGEINEIAAGHVEVEVGWLRVEFFDASIESPVEDVIDRAWLWHEIVGLSHNRVRCHVLLDDGEFAIAFQNVAVLDRHKKRWIISTECAEDSK